jgi:hypothetical protein
VGDGRGGDELVAAFARWAATERVAEAVRDRTRERRMREEAAASATLIGILVDLAEQAAGVVIGIGEHRCSGRVVGVSRDFCLVEQLNGRPAIVPLAAVSSVMPDGRAPAAPAGDRDPVLTLSLVSALAVMAEDRAPVAVRAGPDHIEGELTSAGEDVICLRTGPPARRIFYVPVGSLTYLEVR